MILEQGGGWDKTGRALTGNWAAWRKLPLMLCEADAEWDPFRVRSRFRLGEAATLLRMTDLQEDAAQLFSLLARFQEISSPMVELVLDDTGCL